MLNSPVKRLGKDGKENVVYIFSRLPNSNIEMKRFLRNKPIGSHVNHKDIFEAVFNNGGNSMNKPIMNVFKGDANIRVSFVDTDSLYQYHQPRESINR